MVVDFSRTINWYKELDAYSLPNLTFEARKIAGYRVFSTFELKSAYLQVRLQIHEKKFTAFEANGKL